MVTPKPDEDMLIAGIAAQGLWASLDGGASWMHLGQGMGSETINNRPTAIVFDPDHPATFWESGIYGIGVFKTTDKGMTFVKLGEADPSDGVSVDLSDPDRKTLLAASHERNN